MSACYNARLGPWHSSGLGGKAALQILTPFVLLVMNPKTTYLNKICMEFFHLKIVDSRLVRS